MEISFLNNIKKYNSKSDKSSIANVTNEAFRESEEFKNNVNENLSSENRVLVRDFSLLERQYEETEVRSTTKDIVTVVSSVQAGDFEGKTMQDLTYLLTKAEWEEYYQKNLKFLKEKLGKNAHCVYATVHFDESTPHMHAMFTFAEENKQENNEINYAKIDKALRNNFSNKNKRELNLKAGTKEYKKALEKYKQENMQTQIEKQLKKIQSKVSEKAFKCETGTSAINRDFYRTINQEFLDEMKNEVVIRKLQRKILVFSNEDCEIVKQRSEKYNSFESLDKAKHSMEAENEILAKKINENNYSEAELERFKLINAKRILVEEKKAITQHDFNKKFDETEAKYRSIKKNLMIAETLSAFNIKKLYKNIIEKNDKKKRLIKHFQQELKIFDEVIERQHKYESVDKIIEKAEKIESAEIKIERNKKLDEEYEKKCESFDRLDEAIELMQKKVRNGLSESEKERLKNEAKIEREKIEKSNDDLRNENARLRTLKSEIIREYKYKAKQEAMPEAMREAKEKFEKENFSKLRELEELKRNVEQQRQVQKMNEISIVERKKRLAEIKEESEKIEKEIAEKRSLSIKELAEKSLKTAPVTNGEIYDFIEKNQEKYKDLIEKREEKIENEIVEELKQEMKEDTKKAYEVFKEIVRQYAKKIVAYNKDLIDFREAKQLTIQAFAEVQATSKSFFTDFIENLKSKVQELITMRKNSEKASNLNEKQSRQQNIR